MGLSVMVTPNKGQRSQFQLLVRQGSLYNITLDEIQSQFGGLEKPLSSMNLDELLKTLITTEATQVNCNSNDSSGAPPSSSTFLGNINLNHTQNRKTVDEAWKETVQDEQGNIGEKGSIQWQPTLGEITLEDFLVRAGAITTGNQNVVSNSQLITKVDSLVPATPPADWLHHHVAAVNQQQMAFLRRCLPVSNPVIGTNVADTGHLENQLPLTVPVTIGGSTSSDSQAAADSKRRLSDDMEKSIERRQRRMIKNRESAARSRQRKQAYTNQLEQKASALHSTNERLRRQAVDFIATHMEGARNGSGRPKKPGKKECLK